MSLLKDAGRITAGDGGRGGMTCNVVKRGRARAIDMHAPNDVKTCVDVASLTRTVAAIIVPRSADKILTVLPRIPASPICSAISPRVSRRSVVPTANRRLVWTACYLSWNSIQRYLMEAQVRPLTVRLYLLCCSWRKKSSAAEKRSCITQTFRLQGGYIGRQHPRECNRFAERESTKRCWRGPSGSCQGAGGQG